MARTYFGSNIKVASGFDLSASKPLDSRTVVDLYSDLNTIPDIQLYEGLTVYVIADKISYTLTNKPSREWTPVGAGSGVTTVDTLAYATNTRYLTVAEEVGQLVYLTTDTTITWTITTEIEGSEPQIATGTETYYAGLYQVNAVGSLAKIATLSDVTSEATRRADADNALSLRLTSVESSIAGLSSATHFIGAVDSLPVAADNGDVVVLKVKNPDGSITADKEFIYNKPSDAETGEWIELGDTSALTSAVSSLDGIVSGNKNAIIELSGTVSGHDTSINTLNAFKTDAGTSISNLQTRVTELESVDHPTKDEVKGIASAVQANTSDLNGLKLRVSDLQTKLGKCNVKDVDTTDSNGVALTLTDGEVGVSVTPDTLAEVIKPSLSITSADVTLSANIVTEEGPVRYQAGATIQSVLSSINERLESIDADLNGSIVSVVAGDGIEVDDTTPTQPTVSVKVVDGSALTVGADGLNLVWGTF